VFFATSSGFSARTPENSLSRLAGAGYASRVPRLFHVTSALNRESIMGHGLDWTLMGAAPGIAGSTRPEAEGVFLCRDEGEAGFFAVMNNTGGPVDVWAVDGIDEDQLITTGSGFRYFPGRVPRGQLTFAGGPAEGSVPAAPARRKKKPRAGKR
jgi:hypothetical protein